MERNRKTKKQVKKPRVRKPRVYYLAPKVLENWHAKWQRRGMVKPPPAASSADNPDDVRDWLIWTRRDLED